MSLPPPKPLIAFFVGTLGIATFSMMDAVMKGLVLAMGTYAALFWRMGIAAVLTCLLFAARPTRPSRAAMRVHVVRGLLGAGMAVLFFWGLARVPLAQGVALAFIAPLISLYLAAVFLREQIDGRILGASLIAFLGVLLIFAGQARADLGREAILGSLSILASAVCYAFNIILMRRQAQLAGPIEAAFFQNLVVILVLIAAWPVMGGAASPTIEQWPMVLLGAGLSVASLLLLTWAYARAEASYLSTTEYTAFLWAAMFGWIIFGEPLSLYTVAGTLLIVAGCILAARKAQQASPALEATV
jgi:S-adenosylmethionine uptake transporter